LVDEAFLKNLWGIPPPAVVSRVQGQKFGSRNDPEYCLAKRILLIIGNVFK